MAKKFNKKCNFGCNSFRDQEGFMIKPKSKTKRILEYINNSGECLTPKQIAKKLKIKRNTVKSILRRLAKDGYICRIGYGEYCSKTTYGMVKPLRIHNLRFRIEGLKELVKGKDLSPFSERIGDAEIRVHFGKKRGLVTGWLSCDRGFDYQSLVFAVRFLSDIIKRKVGAEPKDWYFTSKEWNVDHIGVRLDNRNGFRCLTIQEFEDFLVRLYQKDDLTLRAEVKDSMALSLDDLLSIMRSGNVGALRDARILHEIIQRLDAQTVAIKYFNRTLEEIKSENDDVHRLLKTLIENQFKQLESMRKLNESLSQLIEFQQRLTEPLNRIANLWESQAESFRKRERPSWMV